MWRGHSGDGLQTTSAAKSQALRGANTSWKPRPDPGPLELCQIWADHCGRNVLQCRGDAACSLQHSFLLGPLFQSLHKAGCLGSEVGLPGRRSVHPWALLRLLRLGSHWWRHESCHGDNRLWPPLHCHMALMETVPSRSRALLKSSSIDVRAEKRRPLKAKVRVCLCSVQADKMNSRSPS